MADGYELLVKYNRIPAILKGLDRACALGIDRFTADVLQASIADTPTDTGGLRASGFRITEVFNNYGSAVGAMQSRNPKAQAIDEPSRDKNGGLVGFAADYARPVHDGHHTRSGGFVAAQPFLQPHWDANKTNLTRYVGDYIRKLAGTGNV